jgi:hypothetical protein
VNLDFVRKDIEYRVKQIGRQKRDIVQLKRLGLDTAAAEELLARMTAKVEELRAERDRLRASEARTYPGTSKVIRGTQRRNL